ncbi:hypothetical protein ACX80U_17665 [Arthrobacter sp. TmT3-37]
MNEETQRLSILLAARDADITTEAIWWKYFGMTGNVREFELDAYLHGMYQLPAMDRDLIAMALNELIDDLPQPPRAACSYDTPRI